MPATPPTTTVPVGHKVHLVGRSFEPFVDRMPGGLLVACTGRGGDDQVAEVWSLVARLVAQVMSCPIVTVTEATRLEELFAPAQPRKLELDSAAAIAFHNGSLVGWTDEGLEGLATSLHELAGRTKVFVYLDLSHDVLRLKPFLDRAKLELRTPTADGTIAAEVHRPDGVIVTGFVGSPIANDAAPAAGTETTGVLARSPRLEALVLGVVRADNEQPIRALEDYLKTTTAPLALIASKTPTGEFGIQPRSWPGKQGFVAYGDERALHRAARELGMQAGSYAIAAMPPSELFAWAASLNVAVMLCAFENRSDGTSKAWHVPFEVSDLRRLAPRAPAPRR